MFTRDVRKGYPHEQLLSVYREHGVVPKDSRDDNNNRPSDDLSSYQLVEPGDLVVNKMKAWQGSLAISSHKGIVSPAYFVYRPHHRADERYVHHLLRSRPLIAAYVAMSKGVRIGQWDLEPQGFSRLRLPLPPLEEQRAIADYLDRETARIDTLIDEQQRLIELLRERRQTQIDGSVWCGLGNIDRLPGPIGSAPHVPAHWRVLRNKNLLVESTAMSEDGCEELLSVSHLTGIGPRAERTVTMIEAESLDGYRLVEPGDLVINTMWAWMGALGVSRIPGIVSPAYGVYRPLPDVEFHPPYFDYLYRSRPYVVEMTRFSRGIWSSRLRIYPDVFLRLKVVVPPIDEQRRIAAYLDEQTAKVDNLIAETERFIELSRERRSALVTAAVTGQIDVREVA